MPRLLASFIILAGFLVLLAGTAESQETKRKPITGKVVEINKGADGKVASFIVQARKNFNKIILVDDDTKYEYMNKPAKIDMVAVGANVGAYFNKADSDFASIVKITALK